MSKKGASKYVDVSVLEMFSAFIENVITLCFTGWFGNGTEAQKFSRRKILNIASRLFGHPLIGLEQIY